MSQSREICVKDVLSNLATELADLAKVAASFDEMIGDFFSCDGSQASMTPEMLQNVDLFRQRMDCIALLCRNLACQKMAPHNLDADALIKGVYLEMVRKSCLNASGL
nr:hypothetical protein [Roseovarius sp. W115]MDV2928902.1 hypothetical protein [Roseovarius sp. W115]